MARASSARCVVTNEPGRTDMFLSSSLCCETEQKDEQEKLYCFHAALILYLLVLVVAIAN